uniref:Uncharacterized protein n=1 Tax=Nelumbo nucifera TaxID=4432 RepID=A0A822XLL4_NELNU|nr:TPA_asm: hypothetical protein HUJ06_021158 [Nelumbo nucifera]
METYQEKIQDALSIEQLESRVDAHQWRNLVQFWRSEKGTARSTTNKPNRSKQTINHTTGAKSFARVREELKIERETDVSRAEVFYATHKRKDGTPVDPRSGSLMEEMQNCMSQEEDTQNEGSEQGHDDVYARVMGQERCGRVRGLGLGPTPSRFRGPRQSHEDALRAANEGKRAAEEHSQKLEEQIASMRERMDVMEAQLLNRQDRCESSQLRRHSSAHAFQSPFYHQFSSNIESRVFLGLHLDNILVVFSCHIQCLHCHH